MKRAFPFRIYDNERDPCGKTIVAPSRRQPRKGNVIFRAWRYSTDREAIESVWGDHAELFFYHFRADMAPVEQKRMKLLRKPTLREYIHVSALYEDFNCRFNKKDKKFYDIEA